MRGRSRGRARNISIFKPQFLPAVSEALTLPSQADRQVLEEAPHQEKRGSEGEREVLKEGKEKGECGEREKG